MLLGNGDGTFVAGSPVGDAGTEVAVSDFDHDGFADVALLQGGSDEITVWRGDGQGGLEPFNPDEVGDDPPYSGSDLTTDDGAAGLSLGDLDGDGFDDIVVASFQTGNIGMWLNAPELNSPTNGYLWDFSPPAASPFALPGGSSPFATAIADLNGDGITDIVALDFVTAYVLLGDGHGGYTLSSFRPKRVKHRKVKRQKCSGKLVSGPVKFTAGKATATLARRHSVYARGSANADGTKLELRPTRRLNAGRYTLTLKRPGHRAVRHPIELGAGS